MNKIGTRDLLLVSFLVVIILAGCSSTKTVKRVEVDTTIDLSGRWNDTDSRQVSEGMITDCLNHPWIINHTSRSQGKKPVVIVGAIRNRSMEHIAVGIFINDIERAFINSGQVSVVASADERGELRAEKQDQREFANVETIKEIGRELGADYMMTGEINSIEDREGGKQVVFYQTDLTLINIKTNEKIWLGQQKIKKFIERKRAGF
ncbi:MAG: penicillin-binding protein activator LpoB [Candidatus Poribacteria bacterium]|nr:penicillin-binding protein activator LpoB [Candidatus Poribacteria bacterium]